MSNTQFLCLPCQLTQRGDDRCHSCAAVMERGGLCSGCACEKATHDDECLACLAVAVINGVDSVDSIENLPLEWRREVSDEVAREIAYRETRRLAQVQKARADFMAMLVMVARAQVDCGQMRKAS